MLIGALVPVSQQGEERQEPDAKTNEAAPSTPSIIDSRVLGRRDHSSSSSKNFASTDGTSAAVNVMPK